MDTENRWASCRTRNVLIIRNDWIFRINLVFILFNPNFWVTGKIPIRKKCVFNRFSNSRWPNKLSNQILKPALGINEIKDSYLLSSLYEMEYSVAGSTSPKTIYFIIFSHRYMMRYLDPYICGCGWRLTSWFEKFVIKFFKVVTG